MRELASYERPLGVRRGAPRRGLARRRAPRRRLPRRPGGGGARPRRLLVAAGAAERGLARWRRCWAGAWPRRWWAALAAAAVYDDVSGGGSGFAAARCPHRPTWNVVAEAGRPARAADGRLHRPPRRRPQRPRVPPGAAAHRDEAGAEAARAGRIRASRSSSAIFLGPLLLALWGLLGRRCCGPPA